MGRMTNAQANDFLARLRPILTGSGLTEEDFKRFKKSPEAVTETLAVMIARLVGDVGSSVGISSLILSGKAASMWQELNSAPWVHVNEEHKRLIGMIDPFQGTRKPVSVCEVQTELQEVICETPNPILSFLGKNQPVHPVFLLRYLKAWPDRSQKVQRGRDWLTTLCQIDGRWHVVYLFFSERGGTTFMVKPIEEFVWTPLDSILVTE